MISVLTNPSFVKPRRVISGNLFGISVSPLLQHESRGRRTRHPPHDPLIC